MDEISRTLGTSRRTVDQIVGAEQLDALLSSGRPLRIKYGVDCTAPDLHLGHAVNLWLMRRLQDRGHRVQFLLGDLTTRVGDPTGRSRTRPVLSPAAIERNAAAFVAQVSLVLRTDPDIFEVRRNSEWYDRMSVAELLTLFSTVTHARLLERDMFRQRMAVGHEIAFHELTYPVLQAHDSVMLESDLTIVGSDQLFNELLGRQLQQRSGGAGQVVVTTRITPGLDGAVKQSKSLGNYVGLTDTPVEVFGKLMSLRDELVPAWASVYSDLADADVARISEAAVAGGADARNAKEELALAVVGRLRGADAANGARDAFRATFSEGVPPTDAPSVRLDRNPLSVLDLVRTARPELGVSASRRLIDGGAVRLDGQVLRDPTTAVTPAVGMMLRTGRRVWHRIVDVSRETST